MQIVRSNNTRVMQSIERASLCSQHIDSTGESFNCPLSANAHSASVVEVVGAEVTMHLLALCR